MEGNRAWDYSKLVAVLAVVGVAYFFAGYGKPMTWDEASHSIAALFYADALGFAATHGFSLNELVWFSADYHMHYKMFNIVSSYPPFFYVANLPLVLIFGALALKFKILVIIEALITLFYVFRTARLYDGRRWFAWAAVLLLASHPVFVDISTRNYLDTGFGMLMLMSFFYFTRFLRDQNNKDLYRTGILLGLGFLAKPMLPVILLVFGIVLILDGKLVLIRERPKQFLLAIALMLVFMSPFLIQNTVISSFTQDRFLTKWTSTGEPTGRVFPDFQGGPVILAHRSHIDLHRYSTGESEGEVTDFMQFTKYSTALMFQWYLIPFFLIGLAAAFRRHSWEIEKMSVLIIVFILYILCVMFHVSTLKYIAILLPFSAMIAARGLYDFFYWKKYPDLKRYLIPVIAVFVAVSCIQAFYYWESVSKTPSTADLEKAALFVLSDSIGKVTVLTTFPPMQIFEFQVQDRERRVYINYIPRKSAELEQAIKGDFSYAETGLWERYNITYPKPSYIIAHERMMAESDFDYKPDYLLSRPDEFQLALEFEGKISDDKTYIFRVIE